jgi:hypothetical protein
MGKKPIQRRAKPFIRETARLLAALICRRRAILMILGINDLFKHRTKLGTVLFDRTIPPTIQ